MKKLWKHQEEGISRAAAQECFAFFFEQGCGKTLTVIKSLEEKYQQNRGMLSTIVFCPPVVVENWAREMRADSNIPRRLILPLSGPVARRKRQMENMGDAPFVAITNYEAVYNKDFSEFLLKWSPGVVVLDESHYIKDIQAKRTKFLVKLCDKSKHRFLASGTPYLNSPMDIFAQFRALDGGKTFGKNVYAFRAQYFEDRNAFMRGTANYFPKWEPREGALHRIKFLMRRLSMRVTKEEALDLPPLVIQNRYVELSPEQARVYQELKRDFISFLSNGSCAVASMALTQALRLQQVVAGFVKTDDGNVVRFSNNPRRTALKEELQIITAKHKCIVWCIFKEDYETVRGVCRELGIKYVEVHGETADRQGSVDAFNTIGSVRVLIGHPRAGGIGVNLTAASYAIFYSRNFSLGDDLQARARNHRGGSEVHDKITQINLVAPGTVDEVIDEVLSNKIKSSNAILDKVKETL